MNTTTAFAGLRQTRKARSTGTDVSIYDGEPAGMDTDSGRWQLVCETHATVCSVASFAIARSLAAAPEEWCEACQDARYS